MLERLKTLLHRAQDFTLTRKFTRGVIGGLAVVLVFLAFSGVFAMIQRVAQPESADAIFDSREPVYLKNGVFYLPILGKPLGRELSRFKTLYPACVVTAVVPIPSGRGAWVNCEVLREVGEPQ